MKRVFPIHRELALLSQQDINNVTYCKQNVSHCKREKTSKKGRNHVTKYTYPLEQSARYKNQIDPCVPSVGQIDSPCGTPTTLTCSRSWKAYKRFTQSNGVSSSWKL